MTRRNEGEATFEADGQTWRLRFDFNAMADFEAETGKNALQALEGMETGTASAQDIRALVWAALRDGHPDVTLRQAGRLVVEGLQAFQKAAVSALPSPSDQPEGDVGKTKADRAA